MLFYKNFRNLEFIFITNDKLLFIIFINRKIKVFECKDNLYNFKNTIN